MKQLFFYFSQVKQFIFLVSSSFILGMVAYSYILQLPKPETIPELIKFYFNDPGKYLLGTLLILVASFLFAFSSIEGAYMTWENWDNLTKFIRFLAIISVIIMIIITFYFLTYFSLVIGAILLLGVAGIVVIKAIDN